MNLGDLTPYLTYSMSCTVPVPGTGLEEGVVGVEYLPADDDIPLPQQPASVLALLTWGNISFYIL
jgi:hypothetical protein